MGPKVSCAAEGLLHGVVGSDTDENGWTRPQRFTAGQLKALGSCRAWHPGLYRQLAAATAGVSLQFETDSSNVWLEAEMDPMPRGSEAVVADVERYATGVTPPYDGFSADVDDVHLPLALPDEGGLVSFCVDVAEAPEPGVQRLPGMGGASTHRVTIWLPCLGGCEVRSVMGDGTFIEPVAERGQLLVLGDSISQALPGRAGLPPSLASSWSIRAWAARSSSPAPWWAWPGRSGPSTSWWSLAPTTALSPARPAAWSRRCAPTSTRWPPPGPRSPPGS